MPPQDDVSEDADTAQTTPPSSSLPPPMASIPQQARVSIGINHNIVLDPKERAEYRSAMSVLVSAMTEMDRRVAAHYAIGVARNIIDDALMTSPIPAAAEKIVMAVLDELIKELTP